MTRIGIFFIFSGDYDTRFGITDEQMFEYLETNECLGPLHFGINEMQRDFNIMAHMRARDEFPYGIIIMDGSDKCGAGPYVEEEKRKMRAEARKPPLRMHIQTPDPHGTVSFNVFDIND